MHQKPHRRFNPLNGQWILVSPQRAQRPWLGQAEDAAIPEMRSYDPECYLCAGNVRANGKVNPEYIGVYVFDNDFAALLPDADEEDVPLDGLFRAEAARGTCRVVCFSPDHGKSLAQLDATQIRSLIDTWANQTVELSKNHAWVQLFENKGSIMGCSNPHPHGQIWATGHVPDEVATEAQRQTAYFDQHGEPMLLTLVDQETNIKERIVVDTEYWMAIVPWWASWPFELLLLPKFAVSAMPDLDESQREDLARALQEIAVRYDNLFRCSFPYSMGWHGAPFDGQDYRGVQLHAHFYPPLLRSATVRKFMVGYEMMAEAQRDLTPEQAASALREAGTHHFLDEVQ